MVMIKEVPMYQVSTRVLERQPTLVMRAKVPVEQLPEFLGKAYGGVAGYVEEHGLDYAGMPFGIYRLLDEATHEFEVEAGFPVLGIQGEIPGDTGVESSSLPGGNVAVVTHIGPYDQMTPAYDAIAEWMANHGHDPDGPAWEVYYSDAVAEPDPSNWKTEIVQPYR
jgi:effector-binding domain-containing protein